MSPEQRRAATYLRISQDRENTRLGVDRHREDAEALIAARRWTAGGVYEDNDISGKGHKKRPAFERLLKDIASGLVDVVVAQEWPRLERNRADGVRIIETAQRNHVLLTFAKGSDIDCTTAAGRLSADMFYVQIRASGFGKVFPAPPAPLKVVTCRRGRPRSRPAADPFADRVEIQGVICLHARVLRPGLTQGSGPFFRG